MGRKPMPIELAILKGADRKNPKRFMSRKSAPRSEFPLGEPPDHLTGAAKAAWLEISAQSLHGTLGGSDRFAVEVASNLVAEYREAPRTFTAAKLGQLRQLLASFGMTPVDRMKLGVANDDDEDANPFAQFSRVEN